MTDAELLAGFEACTLESFHHADHVRVAWIILRHEPLPAALEHFITSLKRFATAAGAPQKYDDALTRRYMARIAERMNGETSWAEFATANPHLLLWPPNVGRNFSPSGGLKPALHSPPTKIFVDFTKNFV